MTKAISYTLVFLGIQLLTSTLAMTVLQATGHAEWVKSPYTNIAAMTFSSLLTLAVFLRFKWAEASRSYLLSRPLLAILWSALAGIGVVLPSMYIQELMPELPNLIEEDMISIISTPGGYFVICLLAPLVEELVMRGAVLRSLLQWMPEKRWGMIALSALLFAIIHMNPAQMPHAFVMGLLLGWMYVRTDSIVPGVAFHWANNTVAYLLMRIYPDPDAKMIDLFGDNRHVIMAVAFSLCILLPALFQLYQQLKKATHRA